MSLCIVQKMEWEMKLLQRFFHLLAIHIIITVNSYFSNGTEDWLRLWEILHIISNVFLIKMFRKILKEITQLLLFKTEKKVEYVRRKVGGQIGEDARRPRPMQRGLIAMRTVLNGPCTYTQQLFQIKMADFKNKMKKRSQGVTKWLQRLIKSHDQWIAA